MDTVVELADLLGVRFDPAKTVGTHLYPTDVWHHHKCNSCSNEAMSIETREDRIKNIDSLVSVLIANNHFTQGQAATLRGKLLH